jgi:hypothetical protein
MSAAADCGIRTSKTRHSGWPARCFFTEDATLWIARGGASVAEAAVHLGISEQMVTHRLNITGARKRVARAHLRIVE